MSEDWAFVDNEIRIRCSEAVELVTDFLDDSLSVRDLRVFEQHLESCEGCRVFIDQFRMTIRLIGAAGQRHVELHPPNFEALVAELKTRASELGTS